MWSYYAGWVGLIIASNCAAAAIAHARATRYLAHPYKPLPDVLHQILPRLPMHTPDYCLLICLFVVACGGYPVSARHLKQLLCTLSLRPMFIMATTLPTCMPEPPKKRTWYSQLFLSSHDLIFSGHTCLFQFAGVVTGGSLGNVLRFVFPITLISAHQHYTIDVMVAMCVYEAVGRYM